MLSADVKKVAIMQPEGREHALNFEKMIRIAIRTCFCSLMRIACAPLRRRIKTFWLFFQRDRKIMCWHCGNPGVFRSGMLDEDMEAVAKAYAEKDGQRNYRFSNAPAALALTVNCHFRVKGVSYQSI